MPICLCMCVAALGVCMTWGPGAQVPMHTITILLGLVFCCMNPLVPCMCLLYFLINSLTEKYNMMYVMQAKFQSGGRARAPR